MKLFLLLFLSIITMPLAAQTFPCDTSACGTRINDFEEQQCRAKKVLVCKGYSISALPTIELEIQPTSHVVYLSVGDLPRVSLQARQTGKKLNISHMFANGTQSLRVQAFRGNEQYSLSFKILYNGVQLHSISCNASSCPLGKVTQPDLEGGPFFDRKFDISVSSPVQLEQYSLSFSGLNSGLKSAVYINDQYTGLSVAQASNLRLPPSEYRIGVGVSSEQEVAYGSFQSSPRYLKQYTGQYYEQRVQRASDLQNFANLQPLSTPQNTVRIGVVPIKTMNDGQQTYTLIDNDVARLNAQLNKTITSYVQPLSYGLQTWNVTFEPMYTTLVTGSMYTKIVYDDQGQPHGEVLAENFVRGHRPDLINKYDVVIAYYGNANHGGAAAGNGFIHLPSGLVRGNQTVINAQGNVAEELPLEIIYHEVSHVLEQHEGDMLRQWQAFAGADSGDMLGYHAETTNDNPSNLWTQPRFMNFNRDYARGQVLVLNSMSHDSQYPAPATPTSSTPYRYVGLFGTIRNGMKNVHDEPQVTIPTSTTVYRIFNARFGKYVGAGALPSATIATWTLQPYNNEYVRLRNEANTSQFLHIDEQITDVVRSAIISDGAWSSHWVPVEIEGRTLLKSRWNGKYLALTNTDTLVAVTNEERRTLPVDQLAWDLIPHVFFNNLIAGYSYIKNASSSTNGYGVHIEYGSPTATSNPPSGWLSSQWSFKVIDWKYVKITSRWDTNRSLHVENGPLEASTAPDGWHSAQWELVPVAGLTNTYRLKNRHQPNQYLNIDGTVLKSSVVPATNTSTYWTFPKVQ